MSPNRFDQVSRCLLPWVPLIHGGGETGIIHRWIELASQEADSLDAFRQAAGL